MGKNAGGKHQKSMKNSTIVESVNVDDITPNAELDHTFAALVTKSLGSKRFMVTLLNSSLELNSVLPGSFRRRVNVGDFVFVQYEDGLSNSNCFILHIYSADEMRELDIKKPVIRKEIAADDFDDFEFEDI
jgi:translation initiation factor IF-1